MYIYIYMHRERELLVMYSRGTRGSNPLVRPALLYSPTMEAGQMHKPVQKKIKLKDKKILNLRLTNK